MATRPKPQPAVNIVAGPSVISADLLDDSKRQSVARRVAKAISKRGFCVCTGGIEPSDARREVDALFRHGAMQPGGFTVAGRDDVVTAKRDDHTLWLHEYLNAVGGPERGGARTVTGIDGVLSAFGEAVVDALSQLDEKAEPLGRAADGGRLYYTGRTDLMLACYPGGGAAYGPHVDNVDGDGRESLDYGRCFTMVYYLNEQSWDERRDGGSLRVHLAPRHVAAAGSKSAQAAMAGLGEAHDAVDIVPRGDTLVIFRADRMLHEVRPASSKRYAATLWLYAGTKAAQAKVRTGEASHDPRRS